MFFLFFFLFSISYLLYHMMLYQRTICHLKFIDNYVHNHESGLMHCIIRNEWVLKNYKQLGKSYFTHTIQIVFHWIFNVMSKNLCKIKWLVEKREFVIFFFFVLHGITWPTKYFFFGKCFKKTTEYFLIFFLIESTNLPVNNWK